MIRLIAVGAALIALLSLARVDVRPRHVTDCSDTYDTGECIADRGE
jgi:hypothetical protein